MKRYRIQKNRNTQLKNVELVEGETIEQKVERIVANNEPIKDGASEIFTERKEGVLSAYNIRTDRWEIAAEAMDKVQASYQARREERAKNIEEKAIKESGDKKEIIGDKPTQGTE